MVAVKDVPIFCTLSTCLVTMESLSSSERFMEFFSTSSARREGRIFNAPTLFLDERDWALFIHLFRAVEHQTGRAHTTVFLFFAVMPEVRKKLNIKRLRRQPLCSWNGWIERSITPK
ncbi:hypothetical protein CDAR_500741 [Caerostris darwini]|uniref:Uncharacterized protein n=1 Tax=Caerostris darwini TaxID=1538125 RepID=A0AAV4V1P0_9ARAC|nr:hypothetical protein CDAR_500741 [Caerostris darwini]